MLQHFRPVKVVLTPLHLRVLFRESVLALGFALALERESPSLDPFPESRVGGWQARWCVSCALMVQAARTTSLGFRTARFSVLRQIGYSQLAARIRDPVSRLKRDIRAVHTRLVFPVPWRSGDGGSGMIHSPLGALSAGRKMPKMK